MEQLELLCIEKDCKYDRVITDEFAHLHENHQIIHIDDMTDQFKQIQNLMEVNLVHTMFEDIEVMSNKFLQTIERQSKLMAQTYREDLLRRFQGLSDCKILLDALQNRNLIDVRGEQITLPLLLCDSKNLDKLLSEFHIYQQQCVQNYDSMDRKAKQLFSNNVFSIKYKNLTKNTIEIIEELKDNKSQSTIVINLSQNEQLIKTQVDRNIYHFEKLFEALFSYRKLNHLSLNFQYADTEDFEIFFKEMGAGICKQTGILDFKLDMSYTRTKEIKALALALSLTQVLKMLDLNFNNTLLNSSNILLEQLSSLRLIQHLTLNFGQTNIDTITLLAHVIDQNKDLRNIRIDVSETQVVDLNCIATSLTNTKYLRHFYLIAIATQVRQIDQLLEAVSQIETLSELWIDLSQSQLSSVPNIAFKLFDINEFCLNFCDTQVYPPIKKRFRSLHSYRMVTNQVYKQKTKTIQKNKKLLFE